MHQTHFLLILLGKEMKETREFGRVWKITQKTSDKQKINMSPSSIAFH